MKKLTVITLALTLALSLAACGGGNTNPPSGNTPTPPASNTPSEQPTDTPTPDPTPTTPDVSDPPNQSGTYTITIHWNDENRDGGSIQTITTEHGNYFPEIVVYERVIDNVHYMPKFYTDAEMTIPFDFGTVIQVTSDITLYAKWN